jgi:hypothetical protein
MKNIMLTIFTASFLFVSCNNDGAKKEEGKSDITEKKEESKPSESSIASAPPDSAAVAKIMQAWMDFATPGDEHKWLAKSTGTWLCDSVAQWQNPSAPPSFSKATSIEKGFANGLYMEGEYSSDMMGQPMMGKSIFGYDKMKKKYVMSWVDNMGSGIVRMEGDYDAATKILNMKGKQSDPSKGIETDIRQEQKWIDDNTYVLSMYGTGHDGKTEQKFMEGKFKRKK